MPKSRLKPVQVDFLESVGLPSKGETWLSSLDHQETYFTKLVERARELHVHPANDRECSESYDGGNGEVTELQTTLQALHLAPETNDQAQFDVLLQAMRKVREALVATRRTDGFARRVYLYIVRVAVSLPEYEAYHPVLLLVFRTPRLLEVFSDDEREELARYSVLDLAGRQDAIREAWEFAWRRGLFKRRLQPPDRAVKTSNPHNDDRNTILKQVLRSAVRNNLLEFHAKRQLLLPGEQKLLEPLERRLTKNASACLTRAYFAVDLDFAERVLNHRFSADSPKRDWASATHTQGWKLEDERVVFRTPKAKLAR